MKQRSKNVESQNFISFFDYTKMNDNFTFQSNIISSWVIILFNKISSIFLLFLSQMLFYSQEKVASRGKTRFSKRKKNILTCIKEIIFYIREKIWEKIFRVKISIASGGSSLASKIRAKETETASWENRKEKSKKRGVSDRFSSLRHLALAFSFAASKKHGFFPSCAGEARGTALPSSLPRFISIFLRAFCVQFHLASLPRHVLFLFPRLSLCHSRSRRTRSSCFTPPQSFLYHPHSSLCSPLSIPTLSLSLSFSLRFFALLIHFTTVVPSFALLFLVSRSFHRFFHDPPLTSFHPSPNLFPLSLRALVPFTHSLFPSRLRRYFLVAPSLPRLYATLLSLSLSLLLTPTIRRDYFPFSLVLPYISVLALSLPLSLSLLSSSFFFPPLYPSIYLSVPFPPRTNPAAFFLSSFSSSRLDPPVLSPQSAFYVFPTLSTRRLLASSRIFPFRGHRTRDDDDDDDDDDQPALSPGKRKRKRPLPLSPLPLRFLQSPGAISRFQTGRDWNLPRDLPPLSSFAVLSSSLSSR